MILLRQLAMLTDTATCWGRRNIAELRLARCAAVAPPLLSFACPALSFILARGAPPPLHPQARGFAPWTRPRLSAFGNLTQGDFALPVAPSPVLHGKHSQKNQPPQGLIRSGAFRPGCAVAQPFGPLTGAFGTRRAGPPVIPLAGYGVPCRSPLPGAIPRAVTRCVGGWGEPR